MTAQHPANYSALPADLPRPEDDGGAAHLTGMHVPGVTLRATSGELVDLSILPGRTIVYAYPRTGVPGVELPPGWNDIPGARGCTPQTQAFQDQKDVIAALGARLFGLSTQTPVYQKELSDRLGLSFAILSDAAFELTEALRLPTMTVEGTLLLKRLTLVINAGTIEHVFYPVFPPNQAAADVIAWLRDKPAENIPGVLIYTTANCPYCKAAKELLKEKGIAFTEVDVGRDPGATNTMVARSGGRHTVPQIFIGRTHVGGADELQALSQSEQLIALLCEQTL